MGFISDVKGYLDSLGYYVRPSYKDRLDADGDVQYLIEMRPPFVNPSLGYVQPACVVVAELYDYDDNQTEEFWKGFLTAISPFPVLIDRISVERPDDKMQWISFDLRSCDGFNF